MSKIDIHGQTRGYGKTANKTLLDCYTREATPK